MTSLSKGGLKGEEEGQARSSVLNPLQWMVGICIGGMTSFLKVHAPNWMQVLLAVLLVAVLATFLAAYIYFMLKAPDALRSERYGLTKHEMNLRYAFLKNEESIVTVKRSRPKASKGAEGSDVVVAAIGHESVDHIVPLRFYADFYSGWPKLPKQVQDALSQFLANLQRSPLNSELLRKALTYREYLAYECASGYTVYWKLISDAGGGPGHPIRLACFIHEGAGVGCFWADLADRRAVAGMADLPCRWW